MNALGDPPNTVKTTAGPSHALVVEDNLTNQEVVGAILQSLNFDVSFAPNGAIAVEMVRIEEFDIILMDIQMPVMDGFTATRKIRDMGGWCASVPIIAVTANEMANDRAAYVAAGMDDLVPKPIKIRQFADTVLRHLAKAGD
ncbi:MAG: response regulator [Proteobacteria bacterium]|nr:response regulator [Pseudomonadota bacterium]